jgi:DNA-binding GntR family transcriptional regulator
MIAIEYPPGMGSVEETPLPAAPLTKSAYAYEALRRKILDGELRPGERLRLRPMAEELGLSVMPVRDAVRLLERDGLVHTESHRGATVAPIVAETVISLIGIRMWLEVLCARETALLHDDASLALVHQRLDEAQALVDAADPLAYARANRALHEAIAEPASSELQALMRELWDRSWQARRGSSLYGFVPDRRPEAQAEHRAIVRALDERDPDAAAAAMLVHREATLASWRGALRDDPAPLDVTTGLR